MVSRGMVLERGDMDMGRRLTELSTVSFGLHNEGSLGPCCTNYACSAGHLAFDRSVNWSVYLSGHVRAVCGAVCGRGVEGYLRCDVVWG